MDDLQTAADTAADEVVTSTDDEVTEATENPEHSAEQTADEEKTRSQIRREQRQAREQRLMQEAAEAKARAAEAEKLLKKVQAAPEPEPKETDFDDWTQYSVAKALWQRDQAAAKRRVAEVSGEVDAHREAERTLEAERVRERLTEFEQGKAEARARYADFDAVFDKAVISKPLAELILESDASHDVVYFLGQNPERGHALSSMSPVQAARELGKIEAQLKLPRAKTVSSAPNPINPVKGNAGPSKVPDSFAEWKAKRESGWTPT